MPRTAADVCADIRTFRPIDGDWRPLDQLIAELWATGEFSGHVPELLAVLERFPEDDGVGVFWSIVHGVESIPGYEAELLRSLCRQPSELAVTMACRLLNSGVSQIGGEPIVAVLRSVADSAEVPSSVRASAARWVAKHASIRPT